MPPDPLDGTRFLFERKREFDQALNIVRSPAFYPRLEDTGLELSVADTSGMSRAEIWEAGRIVEQTRLPKTLKARAVFQKSFVKYLELDLVRDDVGFAGHANIVGWPSEEEKRQELSGTLALNSTLEMKPASQANPSTSGTTI